MAVPKISSTTPITEAPENSTISKSAPQEEAAVSTQPMRKRNFAKAFALRSDIKEVPAAKTQLENANALPKEVQGHFDTILSEVYENTYHKPVSQRLLELNQKLGPLIYQLVTLKKGIELDKRWKIEDNSEEIVGLKNWQAFASGVEGFGTPVLAILGLIPGGVGQAFSLLSQATRPMVQSADRYLDGKMTPKNFDQQLYFSTINTEEKATEVLKNLLEKTGNLLLEMARQDKQSAGEIFQGR